MHAGSLRRADDLLRVSRGIKPRDVLADRPGKELDVLRRIADVPAKRLFIPLVERRAVEANLATCGLPNAHQKPGQETTSGCARPNHTDTLAGIEREAYIGDNKSVTARWGSAQRLDLKCCVRGGKL